MPEGGATLLSDLARDALAVLCDRCGRRGRYSVAGLLERHGDIGLPDLLAVLARDCPKRIPNLFDDMCAARYDFRALSRSRLLLVNCLERPIIGSRKINNLGNPMTPRNSSKIAYSWRV